MYLVLAYINMGWILYLDTFNMWLIHLI